MDGAAGDTPKRFNERMGLNASIFQFAQNLPLTDFPFPDEQMAETQTDALILLTVYPQMEPLLPGVATDADIQILANQLVRLTKSEGRRILLRLAPEMNGNWNNYGQKPLLYKNFWIRVWNAVKPVAPNVAFVWAPSSGNGYPFTGDFATNSQTFKLTINMTQLDTNRDGVFNAADDAYEPFYPGTYISTLYKFL